MSKLVLFLVCLSVSTVEAKARKPAHSPALLCETCQAVVYDIVGKLKKLPKAYAGLDVQVMGLLETQCENLAEYAGKADIEPTEMKEACKHLMDAGLEADLEENLSKKSGEEKLRKKFCIKKSKKNKICESLWTEEQLPSNRKSPAERNLDAAVSFLAANKEKEGVTTLPSGLQYKVLTKGSGKFSPGPNDPVSCHYAGTLENGDEFDSSYTRGSPAEFSPSGVIKAWTEALQMMVKGDIWELYVHPDLGYGSHGSGPKIGPNALLIFKVEMLSVKGKDDDATIAQEAAAASAKGEVLHTTEAKADVKAEL